MYKYTYVLDDATHEIMSQDPIPHANPDNTITISDETNRVTKILKGLLKKWIQLSEQNDIKWWCGGGTLLGAIRDKGLIHYDNDIDLYFHIDDYERIMQMDCGDNYRITPCEQGLQFHSKTSIFPFIDLWLVAPTTADPNKLILAGPILYNKPSYLDAMVWPNDTYNTSDIVNLEKIPFEDMLVPIPLNSIANLKGMYGEDCLTRYVISNHVNTHYLADVLPHPTLRTKIYETLLRIDKNPTHMASIFAPLVFIPVNHIMAPDKNRWKRDLNMIKRHINERYLGHPSPYGV